MSKLIQRLKKLLNGSPVRMAPATVLSIEGSTCSVQFTNTDLVLSGIRLFAEAEPTGVTIAPKTNSMVLVGVIGSKIDPNDLCICQIMEADTIRQTIDGFTVELNEGGQR